MFANLYSSFYCQYFAKNFLCRLSLKDVEDRINGLIMARVRYLYLHAATMRQRAHAAMRQRLLWPAKIRNMFASRSQNEVSATLFAVICQVTIFVSFKRSEMIATVWRESFWKLYTVYWTVENSLIPWVRGGFCWQRTTTVAQKNVNAQTVDWYRMSTQEPLPDVKLRLSRTYVKCYHIINAQTGKKKPLLLSTSISDVNSQTFDWNKTSTRYLTKNVNSVRFVNRRC